MTQLIITDEAGTNSVLITGTPAQMVISGALQGKQGVPGVGTPGSPGADGTAGPNQVSGLITAGDNVTITGDGTIASPYSISATAGGSPSDTVPPDVPMGMNIGNDQIGTSDTFKTDQNAADLALLDTKLGQKRVRVALPSYNSAAGISNMRQLALEYKADGYFVSYGVTGLRDLAGQTLTAYNAWKAQVPSEAAWASANSMDRFYIGNEEDWQAQLGNYGTVTDSTVRTDVLSMATTLKAAYPDMEIVYSTAQGTLLQWAALTPTTTDLDWLGFNMYDSNFPAALDYFMEQIGPKYFVSEWAANQPYWNQVHDNGYTDETYSADIAARFQALVTRGLEAYFFSLRYGDNTVSDGNWNIYSNTNQFVAATSTVAFGIGGNVVVPQNYVSKDGDTMTGKLKILQTTGDNGVEVHMYQGYPGLQITGEGVDAIAELNSDDSHGVFFNLNSGLDDYANINAGGSDRGWRIGNFGDTDGGFNIYVRKDGGDYAMVVSVDGDGVMQVHGLAGTGTRMVVVDASGNMSTQTIPAGMSNPMTTLGDLIYENATPVPARLAGNTSATKKYLSQTGNGTISAAPTWTQPAISELSGLGTGVATALAVNTGSAGAMILFNGAGGTPSSLTLTSATGLPIATGLSGMTNGTFLTATGATTAVSTKIAPTGTVVGTTDTQTLSGKTVTSLTFTANSTTVAIANLGTTGTLLTTPAIGAIEWDGDKLYYTNSTPTRQQIAGQGNTMTFTNKRITKRVSSATSSATPSISTDSFDGMFLTAQAAAITSFTLSGTPTDEQEFFVRIKATGAFAIAAPSNVISSGVASFPTTTVSGKTITAKLVYDTTAAKFVVMASDTVGY